MINVIEPNWPAPSNIKAYTTLRSIALDYLPPSRQLLQSILDLPSEPFWLQQAHTNIALPAQPDNRDQTADATFTDQAQHICLIFTADCLPILLCNQAGTHVAAIHAGWRGLANGIIGNTLDALGLKGPDLLAWLGPGISQPCYEVGEEVYELFIKADANNASAFVPSPNQRWLADLYALARLQLKKRDVQAIYGGHYCTFSDAKHFFSYRREGKKGRMATLIWMDNGKP